MLEKILDFVGSRYSNVAATGDIGPYDALAIAAAIAVLGGAYLVGRKLVNTVRRTGDNFMGDLIAKRGGMNREDIY